MKQFLFVALGLILLAVIGVLAWPEKSYEAYKVSRAYRAQVDKFHIPDMPDDWKWDTFSSHDGIQMRYGQTGNSGSAQATIIVIPGYTSTMNMYGEQVREIASRGYHVIGFDLRGQGGSQRARLSQPEKLLIDNFRTYSNDVALFLEAQTFPDDRPVILLGMSFGGHVSYRVAAEHPDLVDGILLLAPALRPHSGDVTFEKAVRLLKVGDALGKDKRYIPGDTNWKPYSEGNLLTAGIEHCSSSRKRLPMRDAIFTLYPEQRVGGVTFNWGREFYRSSEHVLQSGYPESINKPVTMLHAEVDNYVITQVNKDTCETRMSDCLSIEIPKSGHCLAQERDPVLKVIYDSLDQIVERSAKTLN